MIHNNYIKILIIGRPNVGKTSIINCLSGSNLKVGNFAGVTTGLQEIMIKYKDKIIGLIDSPGIYSTKNILGKDEQLVLECIYNNSSYDLILNVIDSNKIDSDILLTQQLLKIIKKPILLCFNFANTAKENGIKVDIKKIENETGIGVMEINSCSMLKCCDVDVLEKILLHVGKLDNVYNIDSDKFISSINSSIKYKKIEKINYTEIFDKVILNKILSIPIFLLVIFGIFKLTFEVSSPIKQFIGFIFEGIKKITSFVIQNNELQSFLNDGILQGVCSFLEFLPSIAILFFSINFLEKSGYMVRISFIMDAFMKAFGLSGRAVIPFVSGFGCSIPAYLSARILPTKIQRISAMFAIGFMTCSAKFTFFVMIVGMIFDKNLAPYIMLGIYIFSAFIGMIVSYFVSLFLSKDNINEKSLPYLIEMPSYKFPNLMQILRIVKIDILAFLKKAATFIVICSCVIWILANYPVKKGFFNEYKEAKISTQRSQIIKLERQRLENSILGRCGNIMIPIFAPLGFDWKMNIAALSGLLGKEVGISTLGILYGFNLSDEVINVVSFKNSVSKASSISLIMFFMLYLPCISATATFKKEAEYKYATTILVILTSFIAWIFAFFAYKVALLIF